MRRIAVAAASAALLALGTSGTASADTPGCFGQFISQFAHDSSIFGTANLGQYISGVALAYTATNDTSPGGFGLDAVPTAKYFGCAEA